MDILSYENLQIIWFLLWILLWAVYFILDGFDFGIGILMPFLAKTEAEKKLIYKVSGPFWDGNEVWLITAGGVTFAAFPKAYAILFSSLYAPLFILLFALIFRAVAFEFRDKVQGSCWSSLWDTALFLGNFIPALLLGVAFSNLFYGIPIDAKGIYHGTLLSLLHPYALLGGIFFVFMFCVQGSLFLAARTTTLLHTEAIRAGKRIWILELILVLAFLVASFYQTTLFNNYFQHPALWSVLVLAVLFLLCTRILLERLCCWLAFGAHSLFILCVTFFGVLGMFPSLIISSLDPAFNVTLMNSSSSFLTLKIMLVVTLIFIPIVIAYQTWTYIVFTHKLDGRAVDSDSVY